MVSNQHRAQDRITDHAFLDEAIRHLRNQVQRASAGWSVEPSDDGRYLIGSGSPTFRQTVIETYGPYAETIQQYLLTVEPDNTLTLLALLEELQRGISVGAVAGGVRKAAVRYAQAVLGRKHTPADRKEHDRR